MKKKNLNVLVLILFAGSCKTQSDQLVCFSRFLKNSESVELFQELRHGLKDTLINWAYVKNYENVQSLKRTNWEIDEAVFINPEKNRAILLLLLQDTARYTTVPSVEGGAEMQKPVSFDDVHLILANKESDGWRYFYQSMESFVIPRSQENITACRPTSFEDLSLAGRRTVLRSYYKNGSCVPDPEFFETWDINILKKNHKKINGYYDSGYELHPHRDITQ